MRGVRRARPPLGRRSAHAALFVSTLAALTCLPRLVAHAQDIELTDNERKSYRSSQSFGLSLHFGPYRPDIDGELKNGGANGNESRTPYADFFGGRKLLGSMSLEWQFLRRFGTLAVGGAVGYFSATGSNPLTNHSGQESADESRLRLVPLAAELIYRFDVTNERYHVPLVPYVKGGLDYVIWAVNDSNGQIVSDGAGGKARGGTLGYHGTIGLSLVLDFMDPDAAREFDADSGINHTHLFFEYTSATVNGLGQAHKLHVGDNTWNLGLLFEF